MANKYSTLYTRPADKPLGPFFYNGPNPIHAAQILARPGNFSGASASADVIYLCDLVKGERIIGILLDKTGDSNITAADVVIRQPGAADVVIVNDTAAFDAAGRAQIAFTDIASGVVAGEGAQLVAILGSAADAATNVDFVVQSVLPAAPSA